MEKFANFKDGGTFEALYNQLTDSNKLSVSGGGGGGGGVAVAAKGPIDSTR